MNGKRAEELKQYANGIHIGEMNLCDIRYVLEEFYGVSNLNSKSLENSDLKGILSAAKSILQNNGLSDPSLILRPIDSNIAFSEAYLDDMVYLSYMQQIFSKYGYIKQISNLPMATGYAQNISQLSFNAYGTILGFRRKYKTLPDKPPIDSKDNPKNFALKKDIHKEENKNTFYTSPQLSQYYQTPDNHVALVPYTEKMSYSFNYACSDIIAALAKCYDFDPFICRPGDSNKVMETYKLSHNKYIDICFSDEEPDLYGFLAAMTFYWPAFSMSPDKLKLFYKKIYGALKSIEKKQLEQITARSECNMYIIELLFGFKFYNTTLKKHLPKIKGIFIVALFNIIYYVSECPCCFTRIKQAECIIKTIPKGYFYNGNKYTVHSNASGLIWEKNMLEYIYYSSGKYLPALYYCFLYLCIKNKKLALLEEYLKDLPKTSIFKNNNAIINNLEKTDYSVRMYKLRASHYLLTHSVNQEKLDLITETDSYLSAQIEKMKSNINSISKDIF